jgi:hypothetical protein
VATPTFVAAFSADSGNANVTSQAATLPTVQDGDEAYIEVTSSRGAGAFTGNAPSGWTLTAGGSGGDTTASATCTSQVWRKTLTSGDSGTTVTCTMLSGRTTIGGIVTRGGTFEQITAVTQTGTGVNPADAGITPTAADCLRVIICGYDPASGSSTALTPPASPGTWTEQLEAENTASTTFRPGAYFATTPLTGQAGSAQSAATISASVKPNANTYAMTIAPTAALIRQPIAVHNRVAIVRATTH